jgi:hypothetical protein
MGVMTPRPAGTHLFACTLILLSSCAGSPKPPFEDLYGRENLASYTLMQVRGTRDGDRLDVEAIFGDGSSTLAVRLHFAIGSPTKLESGRWEWARNDTLVRGSIAERSLMFLGGQDGPPSVGGRFDLLDPSGTAHYRVIIPTTELKTKLP